MLVRRTIVGYVFSHYGYTFAQQAAFSPIFSCFIPIKNSAAYNSMTPSFSVIKLSGMRRTAHVARMRMINSYTFLVVNMEEEPR